MGHPIWYEIWRTWKQCFCIKPIQLALLWFYTSQIGKSETLFNQWLKSMPCVFKEVRQTVYVCFVDWLGIGSKIIELKSKKNLWKIIISQVVLERDCPHISRVSSIGQYKSQSFDVQSDMLLYQKQEYNILCWDHFHQRSSRTLFKFRFLSLETRSLSRANDVTRLKPVTVSRFKRFFQSRF